MSDKVIAAHRERQNELLQESTTIMAQADAEGRELTDDEQKQIDSHSDEFDNLEKDIARRQRVAAMAAAVEKPRARRTDPDPIESTDDEDGDDPQPAPRRSSPLARGRDERRPPASPRNHSDAQRGGFRTFGDFVMAVKNASLAAKSGGDIDQRLMAAAATNVASEGSGAEGGFAVPPDYRATIMERAFGEESLFSRTDRQSSASNTMTFPTDMTTPWQTTGGIQAFWEGEKGNYTQSRPELQDVTVRLNKITALVPVTEELLDDAPAMGSYVARKAAEKIDFKVSSAIVFGNGVGQPLGYMNSPAMVTQAAEGGQTADTIVVENVLNMHSRMPIQNRRSAVWLIHPDLEPQLPLMKVGDTPVYMPPGGVSQAMYGSLLSRPVIPHQVCKTKGDLGDIMLVDLSSYLTVAKAGGLRSQTSIHLWFDQDIVAFKFSMRLGGQPWWSTPIASLNGSHTMSPFITLAAR